MDPKISVVIPTYQGAENILGNLRSLELQTFKEFETIVVIDGSNDNTQSIISEANLNLNLKVIFQHNKGRAGARNTGANAASSEYIIFLDDDVIVNSNLVERYHALMRKNTTIVAGAISPIVSQSNEFHQYAAYLNVKWIHDIKCSPEGQILGRPFLSACNCIIRKDLFFDLNGFDGRLTDAEDYDFAVRAFKKGIPIFFAPEILVRHHLQKTFAEYVNRLRQYENARIHLTQINPEVSKYQSPQKAKNPLFLKQIVYRLLRNNFFIELSDLKFFSFVPKKIRYQLYDAIVTSNSAANFSKE